MVTQIPIQEILFLLETEETEAAAELSTNGVLGLTGAILRSYLNRAGSVTDANIKASYFVSYDLEDIARFFARYKIVNEIYIEKISDEGGLIQEML